jgi:hypothetical protein
VNSSILNVNGVAVVIRVDTQLPFDLSTLYKTYRCFDPAYIDSVVSGTYSRLKWQWIRLVKQITFSDKQKLHTFSLKYCQYSQNGNTALKQKDCLLILGLPNVAKQNL